MFFDTEHELHYQINLNDWYKIRDTKTVRQPIIITNTVLITQLWTKIGTTDHLSCRVRRTSKLPSALRPPDTPFDSSYTACTKYRQSSTTALEFEQPITQKEYEAVLSMYPDKSPISKIRVTFFTPENQDLALVADLYPADNNVIIEVELEPNQQFIEPKWLQNLGRKLDE